MKPAANPRRKVALIGAVVLAAVTLTYSNHFHNAFQFDDQHTIQDNVYIRDLANIPKFFTDSSTFSMNPALRSWRPLITTSLAIDYWLGGGLATTFYFHLSTFLWFLLQLLFMYSLYRLILDRVRPDPRHVWVAWFAAAWYGLHPAIAETINYIIQRGDVLSTLGVVAALFVYARFPERRKYGLYLIPFVLGVLAKPPALFFPLFLLAYVLLFEEQRFLRAVLKSVPAIGVGLALAALQKAMTAATFLWALDAAHGYLITQPYIAFRYFCSFFLPTHLTVDSGFQAFTSALDPKALGGFLFLAALVAAIWAAARRPVTRPIAFGLAWFVLGLAPTSLFPLGDVENDHRMFLPFIGLAIAVTWAGSLLVERLSLRGNLRRAGIAGLACLLLLYALGVRQRNEVWRTPESLWRDAVIKDPMNARGLMAYAAELVNRGAYETALVYLKRAEARAPTYYTTQINLGIANGHLNRDAEAERHFRRAIEVAPKQPEPYYYYARWLRTKLRDQEAVGLLNAELAIVPEYMDARYLLLQIYAEHSLWNLLKSFGEESLKLAPNDPTVLKYLAMAQQVAGQVAGAEAQAHNQPTPENYLRLAILYHQTGRYPDCIAAAKQALRLQPNLAEAYNLIAAAHMSMGQWDEAIRAASQALRINPGFQLARNNLEFAQAQKKRAGH
jgi:tetratricopeptide (TPR) repeat protein